ncbi:hypothetical protein FACS1894189_5940 [Planctomycetales bacterium]|nr:hypothetical protein FACS1894189_5940 [Planctomycetales bacterium]
MRFASIFRTVTPFWRIALPLIFLPVLELLGLYYFFGILFTVLSMAGGGLLGIFILRHQGKYYWEELNRQLDRNEMPVQSAVNGGLLLLAAILLLLPGLITDVIGLLLWFPLTRAFAASHLQLLFNFYRSQHRTPPDPRDVIDIP